jgi:oligopeptide/dipeptide ABC transporter ATP-binding protein
MYAGEVVERGSIEDIFYHALHPYTQKLLECDPTTISKSKQVLPTISGDVPDLRTRPAGCIFAERCYKAFGRCTQEHPQEYVIGGLHACRCFLAEAQRDHGHNGTSVSISSHITADEDNFEHKNRKTPLLSVHDVQVRFRTKGPIAALLSRTRDPYIDACLEVSLDIMPGETYGLVGESGSGKTTLGLAIIGLVEPHKGSIDFSGQELKGLTDATWRHIRQEMSMMFQDPVASLSPRRTARSLVLEPFEIHQIPNIDMEGEAERLFSMVGLSRAFYGRYPHELSGGQARRVGVARALALSPRLIIADEPTAGLDVSVQGEILNLLGELQREFQLSYLIISHNLPVVRHISDKLAIMYLGRLVEQGHASDIFAHPAHPYTKALLDGVPMPDPAKRRKSLTIKGEVPSLANRPPGCEFHTRCPFVQPRCRHDFPERRKIAPGHWVRCHFPL